ncbi:hypothetical protein JVU11DRAFT_2519 [Chiua virens]|nr:hypothetical protein JVU11DRAFT_2519 [Chiua virens]
MSERFTVMFNDQASYEKHKKEVIATGGTIVHDLGAVLLGFTAVIPPTLLQTMKTGNLKDSGIVILEPDSTVRIQQQ